MQFGKRTTNKKQIRYYEFDNVIHIKIGGSATLFTYKLQRKDVSYEEK